MNKNNLLFIILVLCMNILDGSDHGAVWDPPQQWDGKARIEFKIKTQETKNSEEEFCCPKAEGAVVYENILVSFFQDRGTSFWCREISYISPQGGEDVYNKPEPIVLEDPVCISWLVYQYKKQSPIYASNSKNIQQDAIDFYIYLSKLDEFVENSFNSPFKIAPLQSYMGSPIFQDFLKRTKK